MEILITSIVFAFTISFIGLLISVTIAILLFLILILFRRHHLVSHNFRQSIAVGLYGVPFSIIAIVSGYMTGLSRDPAVTAVVPSFLTLIGGVILLVIGKNTKQQIVSSIIVTNIGISLLTGALIGASERTMVEDHRASYDYKLGKLLDEYKLNNVKSTLSAD